MDCSAQVWLNPIWSCGQNALQLSKCCHPPLYSPSLNPRVCTRGLYSIRVFFILFRRGGGSSLGRHLRGNRFSFESGPPDGPLIAPDHLRWAPLIDVTVEIGLWAKGLDTDVMRVYPFVKWLSPEWAQLIIIGIMNFTGEQSSYLNCWLLKCLSSFLEGPRIVRSGPD